MAIRVNLPDGNSYMIPDTTDAQAVMESNKAYMSAMEMQKEMEALVSTADMSDPYAFIEDVREKYRKLYGNSDSGSSGAISDTRQSLGPASGQSEQETFGDPDREEMPGDSIRASASFAAFTRAAGMMTQAQATMTNMAGAAKTVKAASSAFNTFTDKMELADAVDRTYSPGTTLDQMMSDYTTVQSAETGWGTVARGAFDGAMGAAKVTGMNPVASLFSGAIGGFAAYKARESIMEAQDISYQNMWGDMSAYADNATDATFNNSSFSYDDSSWGNSGNDNSAGSFGSDFSGSLGSSGNWGADIDTSGIDSGADFSVDTSSLGNFGGSNNDGHGGSGAGDSGGNDRSSSGGGPDGSNESGAASGGR